MKRVLFVGAAGWTNVGDDLIALRLREWAAARGASSRLVGGPDVGSVGPGVTLSGSLRSRVGVIREVARADWTLIGGGGLLDDRRPNFYRPFTRIAHVARSLQRPYGFIGIGVGPVRSSATARDYRSALLHASFIHVRDDESKKRLTDIDVPESSIAVSGDVVTWQRSNENEHREDVKYDLAINLRQWEYSSDPGAVANIARSLASVVTSHGLRVALFAMSGMEDDDDREALRPLFERAQIVVGPEQALAVEKTIAQSRAVISMRLHGCLIAASMGRPVVGIAYDPKVAQQADRLGFRSLDLAEAGARGIIEPAILDALAAESRDALTEPPSAPW